ncbi:biotin-dependent carboxyltransferase family protein (plasmid) [Rhodococcoides fascians]|uniref:5-oxoprolinase subunit C family protein n=1 Tax=Rhodococcoides fascians TaxID=1828 RepID=UPI00389B2A5B
MNNTLFVHTAVHAHVTDLGRFTSTHMGIPTNGAADQYSARAANILVGNNDTAPLIAVTATDFVFRVDRRALIAVTGAPAKILVDGIPHSQWGPMMIAPGSTVAVTDIVVGLHTYIAVRGTMMGDCFRGSYAPDPLLGTGLALKVGTEMGVEDGCTQFEHPHLPLFHFHPHIPRFTHSWTFDIIDGLDAHQFGNTTTLLTTTDFVVGQQSNHVGIRLDGARLARTVTTEILSRGVPLGAVEVPPAGELIVLGRGRPVTAGYPVIAVVARASRDGLGQVRPGDTVRLNKVSLVEAHARYIRQQHHLTELRERVRNAFSASGIMSNTPLHPA